MKTHKILCHYRAFAMLIFALLGSYANISQASTINEPVQGNIKFRIYYPEAKPSDTLFITVDHLLFTQLYNSKNIYSSTVDSGQCFYFEIPVKERCGYLLIYKTREEAYKRPNFTTPIDVMEPQFWEAGDSISLRLNFKENRNGLGGNGTGNFSGRGAEKYQIAANSKATGNQATAEINPSGLWSKELLDSSWTEMSTQTKAKLAYLEKHKALISPLSFHVLKADLLYENTAYFTKINSIIWTGGLRSRDDSLRKELVARFDSLMKQPEARDVTAEGLSHSIQYINYLAQKFKCGSWLNRGKFSLDWIIDQILVAKLNAGSKEELLMREIYAPIRGSENVSNLYESIGPYIRKPAYRQLLEQLKKKALSGKFTDFQLEDDKGKHKSLKKFQNKVILIDFWFTGCGKCREFYRSTLSKVEQKWKNDPRVVFISISVDRQKSAWLKSVQSGLYTSEQAINLYTGGSGGSAPVCNDNNITGYPTVVLLNRSRDVIFANTSNLYKMETLNDAILSASKAK